MSPNREVASPGSNASATPQLHGNPSTMTAEKPFGDLDCGVCSRPDSLLGKWSALLGMGLVTSGIGISTKMWMHWLNDTVIYNGERVGQLIANRPKGQSLITVSNHVSSIDDPLAIAPLVPWSQIWRPTKLRWTMCATDRCFTKWFVTNLTICGRVLPITRGQGLNQLGMQMAVQKLNAGDWIHIFPEGTRSTDQRTLGSMKPGIGRLIAGAAVTPVVVPVYHRGLQRIWDRGFRIAGVNQRVDIMVGDPIDFAPLLRSHRERGTPEKDVYEDITQRIGVALHTLQQKLDAQAPSQTGLNRNTPSLQVVRATTSRTIPAKLPTNTVAESPPRSQSGKSPAVLSSMSLQRQLLRVGTPSFGTRL